MMASSYWKESREGGGTGSVKHFGHVQIHQRLQDLPLPSGACICRSKSFRLDCRNHQVPVQILHIASTKWNGDTYDENSPHLCMHGCELRVFKGTLCHKIIRWMCAGAFKLRECKLNSFQPVHSAFLLTFAATTFCFTSRLHCGTASFASYTHV